MIINIKNKKDLITIDLRTKQIRYLKDVENKGLIEFISLSNDDVAGYNFLFKEDKNLFFNCIKEDIKSFLDIDININDLEVLK